MSVLKVNSIQNAAGNGPTKLDLTPAFHAQTNALQAIGNAVFSKVTLSVKPFDTTNCFDLGTLKFTPQVAGYYQINFAVNFSSVATGALSSIYKNGVETFRGSQHGTNALGSAGSAIVLMNGTTDYLELFTYHTHGSVVNISANGHTFFDGCLLFRT